MSWPPRFAFVGGSVALDFAQTGGEGWKAKWEAWHSPADLEDWAELAPGLRFRPRADDGDLKQARALREAIWETAWAQVQGKPPKDAHLALIVAMAQRPDPAPAWRNGHYHLPDGQPFSTVMARAARDALELFGTDRVKRFRKCANPNCYLMFVDLSRPGKRQWCTMERCGGMAKVARHRDRKSKDKSHDH